MNTGNDAREQAAASPSAVGEGTTVSGWVNVYSDGSFGHLHEHESLARSQERGKGITIASTVFVSSALSSQAPPSAVGEGQPIVRFAKSDNGEWTGEIRHGERMLLIGIDADGIGVAEWDGEKFVALSSQAPKPASAGGAEACLAAAMGEGIDEAIANGDIERIRDIWNRRLGAIAAEADTAKEDAADVARYSADDFVAPPPSEWSPAGQRRLIEALEQHKSAPPNRLAPIEARGVVTVDMASLFSPERMPARDEDGHACHPDLSLRCLYDFDPDDEAPLSKECLASLGWEYRITSFDHDDAEDDDDPCETYYRAGIAWQPEPPGPEWRLVCTSQDEDGDWNAWWVRRIAETLRARESAPAVESIAAKGILLALAMFGAIGSARADTLRIDAAGQRIKYNGAVALIEEPTLTSPARLSFVQSGLPIGGSTQGKSPPGAVPFVLEFKDRIGVVHELACVGPPPAFDGVTFHAHFVCEVQP